MLILHMLKNADHIANADTYVYMFTKAEVYW